MSSRYGHTFLYKYDIRVSIGIGLRVGVRVISKDL
jgi:hypothetical protein